MRCDMPLALPLGDIRHVSIPSKVQGYPQGSDILWQLSTGHCCYAQEGVVRAGTIVVCASAHMASPIKDGIAE